jgi:hypothetical protein
MSFEIFKMKEVQPTSCSLISIKEFKLSRSPDVNFRLSKVAATTWSGRSIFETKTQKELQNEVTRAENKKDQEKL